MKSEEIKALFLEFFAERQHRVAKSASLIPDDPTLLLTGAGMVPFKPYFLGEAKPDSPRATSAQKCVRTTDIERVGRTARHLTFFEMLGNFSFGDYYKNEAIPWAWEFLTVNLKLDPERLWCSVYEDDDEAYDLWKNVVGIREERLVRLGAADNFWDMGVTGPCGPCSEILYDQGPEFGCERPDCGIECDCDRYLELWNLVFMQYDRDASGELHPLPKKNIDTGLGLERIASVLQGVKNNFETDNLRAIIDRMADIAGTGYGRDERTDVSLKIVSDHARAMTFMINDGVLPSNEERGYILRRIIRRAVRHGRLLGVEQPFLEDLCRLTADLMGPGYPELKENLAFILSIARSEEDRFGKTLKQGMTYLEEAMAHVGDPATETIPGKDVFYLHDTLGFPLELTREIAEEAGIRLNEEDYERLMQEQKERARTSRAEETFATPELEVYREILDTFGETVFTGYEKMEESAEIKAVVGEGHALPRLTEGDEGELVLDTTPFYGEMGGQVGDTGIISGEGFKFAVSDSQVPIPGLTVHRGEVLSGVVEVGLQVTAAVERERRLDIMRNHTATHLVHWALREVLGEHARQSGSLVEPERFRFDFTHFGPVTPEELARIEEMVNLQILEDHPVRGYVTTYDYAKSLGAIALFGEKYREMVRVVEVDDLSRELCGGTHSPRTGIIGSMVILSESGIGANMRRLEAITGRQAYRYRKDLERQLADVAGLLKASPKQVVARIEKVLQANRELETELAKYGRTEMAGEAERLAGEGSLRRVGDANILVGMVEERDVARMRELAELVRERLKPAVVGIVSESDGKANLVVAVSPDLVKRGVNAGGLVKEAGKLLGGGGGGKPDMAVGGGPDLAGREAALEKVTEIAAELLGGAGEVG